MAKYDLTKLKDAYKRIYSGKKDTTTSTPSGNRFSNTRNPQGQVRGDMQNQAGADTLRGSGDINTRNTGTGIGNSSPRISTDYKQASGPLTIDQMTTPSIINRGIGNTERPPVGIGTGRTGITVDKENMERFNNSKVDSARSNIIDQLKNNISERDTGSTGSTGSTGGTQEPYIRNAEGYQQKLVNPVDDLKSNQNFTAAMEELIKRKQGYSRNLNKQRQALRTVSRDTSAFGSEANKVATSAAGLSALFSDKRLQNLSPAEQRQIRGARDDAINAHIKGLNDESTYRQTSSADTMKALADMIGAQADLTRAESDEYDKALTAFGKKLDLGLPIEDKDWHSVGKTDVVNGRSGAWLGYLNSNVGNLKSSPLTNKYAMKDSSGKVITDYQGHLKFATIEDSRDALKADIKAKMNGGSSHITGVNPTLAELGKVYAKDGSWANSVASILGIGINTRTKSIDFDKFIAAIERQENSIVDGQFPEEAKGTVMADTVTKKTKSGYSQSMLRSIANNNNVSVTDLKNMSDEQISEIELAGNISAESSEDIKEREKASKEIIDADNGKFIRNNPSMSKELAISLLTLRSEGATVEEILNMFAYKESETNPKVVYKLLKEFANENLEEGEVSEFTKGLDWIN